MKYFKKYDGSVWAFEDDGSQDNLIQADMSEMTQPEIESHVNPPKTLEQLAFEAIQATDLTAKQAAKGDSVIQYLVTHTPAECDAYVHTNVTNLATAVNLLGKMAMALSVLARAELR